MGRCGHSLLPIDARADSLLPRALRMGSRDEVAMVERLLRVVSANDPIAPSRVCALLAKRGITTDSMEMVSGPGRQAWTMRVSVRCESEAGLDLVARQLETLVGVVSVVEVGRETHNRRQSVFVTLEPRLGTAGRVGELARMFSAEVIELTPAAMTLHLSADPGRCAQFLSVLDAYNVTHVDQGAVCGTSRSAQASVLQSMQAIGQRSVE